MGEIKAFSKLAKKYRSVSKIETPFYRNLLDNFWRMYLMDITPMAIFTSTQYKKGYQIEDKNNRKMDCLQGFMHQCSAVFGFTTVLLAYGRMVKHFCCGVGKAAGTGDSFRSHWMVKRS